jgi:hypothetical protein
MTELRLEKVLDTPEHEEAAEFKSIFDYKENFSSD